MKHDAWYASQVALPAVSPEKVLFMVNVQLVGTVAPTPHNDMALPGDKRHRVALGVAMGKLAREDDILGLSKLQVKHCSIKCVSAGRDKQTDKERGEKRTRAATYMVCPLSVVVWCLL